MSIVEAPRTEAERLAAIISESNRDVARLFGLSASNAPQHAAFCTSDWVRTDFDRGERYFIYEAGRDQIGCVACEAADEATFYLNRLSVLPAFRHEGVGEKLVNYVQKHAQAQGGRYLSVGIIADHDLLKGWFQQLGFRESQTRRFDHLPFEVCYLRCTL